MRIGLVILGSLLVLISIPGYVDTPVLISQMIHSFAGPITGSIPGTSGGSILHQMGYPSRSTIIPLIQYSFVGLGIAGIGLVGFGSVAKNFKKQIMVKLVTEEQEKVKVHTNFSGTDEKTKTNNRSFQILQERLARGEITPSEFLNLKRLLE